MHKTKENDGELSALFSKYLGPLNAAESAKEFKALGSRLGVSEKYLCGMLNEYVSIARKAGESGYGPFTDAMNAVETVLNQSSSSMGAAGLQRETVRLLEIFRIHVDARENSDVRLDSTRSFLDELPGFVKLTKTEEGMRELCDAAEDYFRTANTQRARFMHYVLPAIAERAARANESTREWCAAFIPLAAEYKKRFGEPESIGCEQYTLEDVVKLSDSKEHLAQMVERVKTYAEEIGEPTEYVRFHERLAMKHSWEERMEWDDAVQPALTSYLTEFKKNPEKLISWFGSVSDSFPPRDAGSLAGIIKGYCEGIGDPREDKYLDALSALLKRGAGLPEIEQWNAKVNALAASYTKSYGELGEYPRHLSKLIETHASSPEKLELAIWFIEDCAREMNPREYAGFVVHAVLGKTGGARQKKCWNDAALALMKRHSGEGELREAYESSVLPALIAKAQFPREIDALDSLVSVDIAAFRDDVAYARRHMMYLIPVLLEKLPLSGPNAQEELRAWSSAARGLVRAYESIGDNVAEYMAYGMRAGIAQATTADELAAMAPKRRFEFACADRLEGFGSAWARTQRK